jgi:thermitase
MKRFAVVLLAFAALGAQAQSRVLLVAQPSAAEAQINADTAARGRLQRLGASPVYVLHVPHGAEHAAAQALSRSPRLRSVEVDRSVMPGLVNNDPVAQWHIPAVNAYVAWDAAQGSGVTVGICDTGTSPHADLRLVPGWAMDGSANTADLHGHGTATAGVAAAVMNNALGVAGLAGGASVMPMRIAADATGYANWSDMAACIVYAAEHGVKVVNLSYYVGGAATVDAAAAYLQSRGGLLVTIADNTGTQLTPPPSDNLVFVAATDPADAPTSFSSWGAYVHIAAPGIGMVTTSRGGGYGTWWGTSFAAPVVAGIAALIAGRRPDLAPADWMAILFASAKDLGDAGRDMRYGYGRVDAGAALALAASYVSPEPPPPPPPPADTTAPVVAIASPLDGARLGGGPNVRIVASATDAGGIASMSVAIDGQVRANSSTGAIAFTWNVKKLAAGLRTITVRAVDKAGNSAAASITVSK